MTGRTLITNVMKDIGKLGEGQPLDDGDAQYVLDLLNDWIDSLATEGMLVYVYLRTVKVLASGTASYTIGSGGDINIARPTHIPNDGAHLIISNAATPLTEIPLQVFTEQEWRAIPQKSLGNSLAQGIYYDRGWTAGLGRIYPWPVPNVATTSLVLYTEVPLSEFTTLNTDYTFPPGYRLFLRTNLAKQIAGGFGKSLSKEQLDAARDASAKVKRANIRAAELLLPPGTPGGHAGTAYDYRTDTFR